MEDAWYLNFKGCFYLHVGAPDHREQRCGYNEESHWLSEALLRSTCIHHHYRHGMLVRQKSVSSSCGHDEHYS